MIDVKNGKSGLSNMAEPWEKRKKRIEKGAHLLLGVALLSD
jgi:hypothetical protein